MLWYPSNWAVVEKSKEQLLAEKAGKQQVFAKKLFPFPPKQDITSKMEGAGTPKGTSGFLSSMVLYRRAQAKNDTHH